MIVRAFYIPISNFCNFRIFQGSAVSCFGSTLKCMNRLVALRQTPTCWTSPHQLIKASQGIYFNTFDVYRVLWTYSIRNIVLNVSKRDM